MIKENKKERNNDIFHSPTKGKMKFRQVIQEVINFMCQEKDLRYRIIIGTDSTGKEKNVDFVSVILAHRVGRGGIYFWRKTNKQNVYGLKPRIMEEVFLSLSLAQQVLKVLKEKLTIENIAEHLEVHADVGPNGETKTILQEIIGMVMGSGFNCKTKPDSFGASCIADKYT